MTGNNFFNYCVILLFSGLENNIRIIYANHRFIRRNYHYREIVGLRKLNRLGIRGSGHTA